MDVVTGQSLPWSIGRVGRVAVWAAIKVKASENMDVLGPGLVFEADTLSLATLQIEEKAFAIFGAAGEFKFEVEGRPDRE